MQSKCSNGAETLGNTGVRVINAIVATELEWILSSSSDMKRNIDFSLIHQTEFTLDEIPNSTFSESIQYSLLSFHSIFGWELKTDLNLRHAKFQKILLISCHANKFFPVFLVGLEGFNVS